MQVHSVPLTAGNVEMCAPMWGGRETYAGGELREVLDSASRLLSEGRALGALILEGGRPRAFGLTTFVDEATVERYLRDPHAQIGKWLLLNAYKADSPVLQLPQIAERNAGRGLQLVVANTAYDTAAHDPATVIGVLMRSFHETHRGYRIARIVNEVFGEEAIAVVTGSRGYEPVRVFDLPAGAGQLRSLVGTLSREHAAASNHPLLAMFAYSPPRLFFTAAEQHLLTQALAVATDEMLSKRLGIPLSAVKARWRRIQERTARMAPELLGDVPVPVHGGRGVQTRHLILQYVREHPSELTPYLRTPRPSAVPE